MIIDSEAKRRGRPKKKTTGPQHVLYIEDNIWDELDNLPIPRQDVFRNAAINAIAFFKSDLPKLKFQREEKLAERMKIDAELAVIDARIKELEEAEEIASIVQQKTDKSKEAAISEMLRLCGIFKKKMTHEHFSIISKLSGVEPAQIEVFLQDKHYRPTEEDARAFLMR